jgi:hypothetical protein
MCEFSLTANPHYSDYLHYMRFNSKMKMVYGECQNIHFEVCGKYN